MKRRELMLAGLCAGLAGRVQAQGAPAYQPVAVKPPAGAGYLTADGAIRIVGWDETAGIFERLNALYTQHHPGTRFVFVPGNLMAPQHSLIFDETALAPTGMEWSANVASAYKYSVGAPPFGVRIAHASLNPAARLSPLAIVVHKDNPLTKLSPGQMLHIFTVGGRAPDIVYWRQAGVSGDLGERRITPYGLPETDHYPSEDLGFGVYLFRDKWGLAHNARNYRILQTYAEVTKRVAEDPTGIGITQLNRVTPDVKVLAVSGTDWAKPTIGTREEVQSGRYPFDRFLYVYARREAGKPLDPFTNEYLRMVLSREGQQAIATEAKGYLPLNAGELDAELSKLE